MDRDSGGGRQVGLGRTIGTILLAGGCAGAIDFLYATGMAVAGGGSVERVWIGVAAALFGIKAIIAVGQPMVIVGIALHFLITMVAAAIYYFAATRVDWFVRHPLLAAIPFGTAFWAVMNYVVVPLSVMGHPFAVGAKAIAIAIISHIILVGLPTTLVTAWRISKSVSPAAERA